MHAGNATRTLSSRQNRVSILVVIHIKEERE